MKRRTVLTLAIIGIISLFSVQWLRDAQILNLNIDAIFAESPLGQLLGATQNTTAILANSIKKGFISDNFTRCSMKLGVEWRWGSMSTDQIKLKLKEFNQYGTRYTTVRISDLGDGSLNYAAAVINEAKNLQIVPIVIIEANATIPDAASVADFYYRLSQATANATFVASTYKASPYDPGVDYFRVEKSIAESVAADPKLTQDPDIVIASPVLGGINTNNFAATQELKFNNLLDTSYFDILLFGMMNDDSGFERGSSQASARGYYKYGVESENVYRPVQFIKSENEAHKQYLRSIIVDYGPTTATRPNSQDRVNSKFVERMAYDFGQFADDLSVEAVVVNPDTLSDPNWWLSENVLGKMVKRATNCNYDIADVNTTYAATAAAPVCATADVADDAGGQASTKVVCRGRVCQARIIFTVQVGLPVAEFTSVNPTGTPSNPYMSINPWISANSNLTQYDFTNQFAGELTDGDGKAYSFPNLGSAINNAGQVIKSQFTGAQTKWEYDQVISPGAGLASSRAEIKSDIEQEDPLKTWVYGYRGDINGKTQVSEEGAVCVGKICMSRADYIEQLDAMRPYDPNQEDGTFKQVLTCGGQVQRVENDQKNVTYGAEKRVEGDVIWSGTPQRMCYEIWKGIGPLEDGGLRCRTRPTRNSAVQCRCDDRRIPVFSEQVIKRGYNGLACNLSEEVIDNCLQYVSGAGSYASSVVTLKGNFPTIPQYKIEGAYDALAGLYKKVQDQLSVRGIKAVFNEGWGWEAETIMRAYRVGQSISNPRKPRMLLPTTGLVDASGAPMSPTPPPSVGGAAMNTNSCRIGVNYAGASGDVGETARLGYSHALIIVNSPTDDASGQLSALCGAGITPVLRSCVRGNCGFSSGAEQGAYLAREVNESSCGGEVFVACGHNEPESEFVNGGSEAAPSGADFQRDLEEEGKWARECLNAFNDASGSGQVTTPTFNATLGATLPEGGGWTIAQTAAAFNTGFGGNIQNAGFACVSFNAYSNVGGKTSGEWYDVIMQLPEFVGMSACINETGYYQEGASIGDSALAGEAVEELTGRGDTLYALLFNSMGTNPGWMQYALADKGASIVAGCGGGNFGGVYQSSLALYPADGNNQETQYQYYAMLGFIDELQKLHDVLAYETTLPTLEVKYNSTTRRAYVQTTAETEANMTAEWLAGWQSCEEPWIKQLAAQGKPVNCLAPYTASNALTSSVSDPLGLFLCGKGYPVSDQCQIQCVPTGGGTPTTGEPVSLGSVRNAACPLQQDNCWQGPLGNATHYCAGADPAFDFYSSNQVVHAPEDGKVVYVEPNEDYNCTAVTGIDLDVDTLIEVNSTRSVGMTGAEAEEKIRALASADQLDRLQSSGAAIGFRGDSGIYYRMRHVNISRADAAVLVGQRVQGGQPFVINGNNVELYHIPEDIYTPCWRGAHLHTWAKTGVSDSDVAGTSSGQYVDEYALYGQVLGCSSANSCGQDRACAAPNWSPIAGTSSSGSTNLTTIVCEPTAPDAGSGAAVCNEFNCFGAGVNNFSSSLVCASNTISGDLNGGTSLAQTIDEYGPFCDNETIGLPFAHNLLNECYDRFAPAAAQRTCQNTIPGVDEVRPQDSNLHCVDFQERNGTPGRSIGNRLQWPEYQYYRGAIDACPIPQNQLGWTSENSKGLSPAQLAVDMQGSMNYLGINLSNTPTAKITSVLETARQKNVNPYLFMCIWATESAWGQFRPSCNVF